VKWHLLSAQQAACGVKSGKWPSGKYPVPTLYDISDSAHFANRADVGIVVHRKTEEETLVRVSKVRFQDQIGKPGDVRVRYVWQRAAYELFA